MNIVFYHSGITKHHAQIGGAETQILLLSAAFARYGHKADYGAPVDADLEGVDIVHITGGDDYSARACENCIKRRKKYFLKPLFHRKRNWDLKRSIRHMQQAEGVFVESPRELDEIEQYYSSYTNEPLKVRFHLTTPSVSPAFVNPGHLRSTVMTVGRYVELKNQKDVIRACKNLNLPVITTGAVQERWVYNECVKLNWGTILGSLTQQHLAALFQICKVYVCASKYEVCSGAVCEATNSGCLIVSSSSHLGASNFRNPGCFIYPDGDFTQLQKAISHAYYSNTLQANKFWSADELAKFELSLFEASLHKSIRL